MFKFLETVKGVHRYDEERFRCSLGVSDIFNDTGVIISLNHCTWAWEGRSSQSLKGEVFVSTNRPSIPTAFISFYGPVMPLSFFLLILVYHSTG